MARIVTVLQDGVTAKPSIGAGCYVVTVLRGVVYVCACACGRVCVQAGVCAQGACNSVTA